MKSKIEDSLVSGKLANHDSNSLLSEATAIEHFQAIIQSSDDAIISKTISGAITSWNAAAESLFGYSAKEMLGRSMLVLFPKERKDEEAFILQKILAGEKVDHFETTRLHKSGKLLNVAVTISPIRDHLGNVVGASKIARDISQQKALDAVRKVYESIIESSDDAIISKSLDGTILSWNIGAEKMFGFSAEEVIGKSIYVLLPVDLYAEEKEIIKKLTMGEKVDHFETIRVCKNGRYIHVSVTISPIRDESGNVVGASKIARDITQRKMAEAHLLLTSSVFTHTYEGIVITDESGIILDTNASFSRISGYSHDEVIGQTSEFFRSSRQGPEIIQEIQEALKLTGIYQGEAWSRRKDGRSLAGLVTINAIKNNNGAIQNYVALISDITSLHEKQERMEHLAHYDALTDLANRKLLADRMQQAMALAIRNKHSMAVLYLDIDNFKSVNDTYGHDIGDKLLIEISYRMKNAIREVDTLARIGGDEFIVLMSHVGSLTECRLLAERVLYACSEPIDVENSILQVSASIGMTVFPQDNADADQLMRHADSAMFEAKQTGKNRIHIFDSALDIQLQQRGLKLAQIHKAFESNEFVLYYQPKVNMRSGKVIGAEALIRWQHPLRGLLPPAEFLPIIENHPLQITIGWWVIETALSQMSLWNEVGLDLSVSVNVDAIQIQHPDFTDTVRALLKRYPQVNSNNLELEILETSNLNDIHLVTEVMNECQSLGVQFSIDDFGTGYSSLTYLRHLPAETLKIDQSFIRGMLADPNDLAIVKGVIALTDAFKRKVIAEGVETDEIGVKLIEIGCDYAQGYAIAKPMHANLLHRWMKEWRPFPNWLDAKL